MKNVVDKGHGDMKGEANETGQKGPPQGYKMTRLPLPKLSVLEVRSKTETKSSEKVTSFVRTPPAEDVDVETNLPMRKAPKKRPGEGHPKQQGLKSRGAHRRQQGKDTREDMERNRAQRIGGMGRAFPTAQYGLWT